MSYKTFEIKNGSVIFDNPADNAAVIEAMKAEDEFKEWEAREAIGDNWGEDDDTIMLDEDEFKEMELIEEIGDNWGDFDYHVR
jgi:hypothetical protein